MVFMGTPASAVPVVSALLDQGYDVVGVLTRPDRPAGRGRRVAPPEVKRFALTLGLRVLQPSSLRRDEAARRELASLRPDVIVVAAYGLLLPPQVLELPRLGCLNVHPSLLPRYRGPSPAASAILNGDPVTGVTIMLIDEGMDSGPTLAQRETLIGADETTSALTARLLQMGASLLMEVLPRWQQGGIEARPQDESSATITRRLTKEDGKIDWGRSAEHIARQVRAYHPWPGAFTYWRGRLLKVREAAAIDRKGGPGASPGKVISLPDMVGIVTGEGVLGLQRVQLEGRRAVTGHEFVRGHPDFVAATLGAQEKGK